MSIIACAAVSYKRFSHQTGYNKLEVTQFHYHQWPEHSIPSSIGSLLKLIDMVIKSAMAASNQPIIVMCK